MSMCIRTYVYMNVHVCVCVGVCVCGSMRCAYVRLWFYSKLCNIVTMFEILFLCQHSYIKSHLLSLSRVYNCLVKRNP